MSNLARITNFTLAGLAIALPIAAVAALSSGPKPGQNVYAFQPFHVTGPDAMTVTCPVCKYGAEPAVQVWVNNASDATVGKIGKTLQSEIAHAGLKNFRAFIVFMEPKDANKAQVVNHLQEISSKYQIPDVALIFVRAGDESIADYHINTSSKVHDTVITYAQRTVKQSFTNLTASEKDLNALKDAVHQVTTVFASH